MRLTRTLAALTLTTAFLPGTALALQGSGHLDRAVAAFWSAATPRDRESAIQNILVSGADPDTVLDRLRRGPEYSRRVPRGRLSLQFEDSTGEKHHYVLLVPSTYDPAHPVPLRIYLHGNATAEDRRQALKWDFDQFGPDSGIALYPSAWREATWWNEDQVAAIEQIVEQVKREYNIDENRVSVIGVADGGTGAFYLAFRHPTPYASFLSLLGHGGALVDPRLGTGGDFYVTNLRNSPFFLVNGALDPLFPVREVAPYVLLYRQAGTEVVFRPQAVSGLDLRWWPGERALVDSFIRDHPRRPFPSHITWETATTDRFNRAWWIVIDSLGSTPTDTTFPALDSITPLIPEPSLGVRADPASSHGVRVLQVALGSLGAAAGLRSRDLIIAVNGVPTPDVPSMLEATRGMRWGDTMALMVERNGARGLLGVVLGPRPDPATLRPRVAFPRRRPTGRIDITAQGNTIEARTSGIRRYRILLSPDQFDLSQPILVRTNGTLSYQGLVPRSVATLLRWAAEDRDRQMLYLGELTIEVP